MSWLGPRLVAAACLLVGGQTTRVSQAVDVSAPAMLQIFEARWDTIEDRMADIFEVGYGQLWLPPPQRADQGGFSVGYDVFDRFDLGGPRRETLYGTEASLKAQIAAARNASVKVYTDFIPNHNGFGKGHDSTFVAQGGYPGFTFTAPGLPFGDFHDPSIDYQSDPLNGSLLGLIDIAHETNIALVRHPTAPGRPDNIAAGSLYNIPRPGNARFYPDQDLGGVQFTDPTLGGATFTRYQFNVQEPLAGDPVAENATGLLMRNMQYMIQVIGVDGFRVDAARHMPTWVFHYLDNAVFRANLRTNFDGTFQPVYMFSEVADGNVDNVQPYIRRDLPNKLGISSSDATVRGNRDALDFPLFWRMVDNLSGNGLQNNWHDIRNASQDLRDDGLRNGSQGVSFVDSHDEHNGLRPHLYRVAYAYTLLMPGQALVYMNAKEFGEGRAFPVDIGGSAYAMSNDALGGLHGDDVARLVALRNSHGRGNFHERWIDDAFNPNGFSNIYVYERENSAVVGLNSRLDAGFDERTVQTGFAPGTVLVELTGNATNPTVDPNNDIRDAVRVNGGGQATIRIPRNRTGSVEHGLGYVVYGVAPPRGTLTLTNVSQTMNGGSPTLATNGTTRLADVDVITADAFTVTLATTPVTLPAPVGEAMPYRDYDADGDQAVLRIDGGMDLNNIPGIDRPNPADVAYAFEDFTDVRAPGYVSDGTGGNVGTGSGLYQQTVDATRLAEGRHYIAVRAFRRRAEAEPPVFTDFKRTIYVDRLPPEAAVVSFDPYASNPGALANRDLIVRSLDGTAEAMHLFLDLPPAMSDAQILALVENGQGGAGYYDRDLFISGFTGVRTGNHAATVVTIEPTGRTNVQRFAGLFTNTGLGAGFGDMNGNGVVSPAEIQNLGNGSFEDLLYSQGSQFNAAADVDGDGIVTNLDLLALGEHLVGAAPTTRAAYDAVLVRRGDVNQDGATNAADVAALYAAIGGPASWLLDLNIGGAANQGALNLADVATLVDDLVRTSRGDFNLDRRVDGADLLVWQRGLGTTSGRFDVGDANLDGAVNLADFEIWRAEFAAAGALASAAAVPESASRWPLVVAATAAAGAGRARRGEFADQCDAHRVNTNA